MKACVSGVSVIEKALSSERLHRAGESLFFNILLSFRNDESRDLLDLGKTAGPVLGKKQPAVQPDIEDAVRAGNQGDGGGEFFFQFRLQPGSARQVISAGAVGDGDVHGPDP
jgi:hypothetical protein